MNILEIFKKKKKPEPKQIKRSISNSEVDITPLIAGENMETLVKSLLGSNNVLFTGRTASGKSTLMRGLFQFCKKNSGVPICMIDELASDSDVVKYHQEATTYDGAVWGTHYADNTDYLIASNAAALIRSGVCSSEVEAIKEVVKNIRYDVHIVRDSFDHRYIERITEIIPENGSEEKLYNLNDIAVYEDGQTIVVNVPQTQE